MTADIKLFEALTIILEEASNAHNVIDASKMTNAPLILRVDKEKYEVVNNKPVGDTIIKPA